MFPETITEKLKKKTEIKTKSYQVCINGCRLYEDNDQEALECTNCKAKRNENGTPVRRMKMFSVGDVVANMLTNSKVRDLMKYRHNFDYESSMKCDYFSGEAYQELRQQGEFQGEDDVALALFVDGFTATKSSEASHLTIVHLINLNLPPELRYQDKYTRQLAILPGPNSPNKLLYTYLTPIVRELEELSTKGMIVFADEREVCRAKVYLVMATGDLPASAELAHHKTSVAHFGCRICRTETTTVDGHRCFLNTNDALRTAMDFKSPNSKDVCQYYGTTFKSLNC